MSRSVVRCSCGLRGGVRASHLGHGGGKSVKENGEELDSR